uniref:RBR-type E3 ubiquitin transferase n=1 Tax=Macrostomum lignano TaxID=282301 RepID=A0A1I8FAS2_9PLAT
MLQRLSGRKRSGRSQCKLCMEDVAKSDMMTLRDCGCAFCRPCMERYVTLLIREGNVGFISCPDGACSRIGELLPSEIESLCSAQLYRRYLHLCFLKEVEMDPRRTFCPRAGCETVFSVPGPRDRKFSLGRRRRKRPERGWRVSCPACGLVFCSRCKLEWHRGIDCDQQLARTHGILFTQPQDAPVKRCPVCAHPNRAGSRMRQMMCKRCRHIFCWYCLAKLDATSFFVTYDNGAVPVHNWPLKASLIACTGSVFGAIFFGFSLLVVICRSLCRAARADANDGDSCVGDETGGCGGSGDAPAFTDATLRLFGAEAASSEGDSAIALTPRRSGGRGGRRRGSGDAGGGAGCAAEVTAEARLTAETRSSVIQQPDFPGTASGCTLGSQSTHSDRAHSAGPPAGLGLAAGAHTRVWRDRQHGSPSAGLGPETASGGNRRAEAGGDQTLEAGSLAPVGGASVESPGGACGCAAGDGGSPPRSSCGRPSRRAAWPQSRSRIASTGSSARSLESVHCHGPKYGRCRDGRWRVRRMKTCVQDSRAARHEQRRGHDRVGGAERLYRAARRVLRYGRVRQRVDCVENGAAEVGGYQRARAAGHGVAMTLRPGRNAVVPQEVRADQRPVTPRPGMNGQVQALTPRSSVSARLPNVRIGCRWLAKSGGPGVASGRLPPRQEKCSLSAGVDQEAPARGYAFTDGGRPVSRELAGRLATPGLGARTSGGKTDEAVGLPRLVLASAWRKLGGPVAATTGGCALTAGCSGHGAVPGSPTVHPRVAQLARVSEIHGDECHA